MRVTEICASDVRSFEAFKDIHNFIVALRSNHGVWMPKGARVRENKWRKFKRKLSGEKVEERFVREIVFGKKGKRRYWEITTDPETLPKGSKLFGLKNCDVKFSKKAVGSRQW